MRAKATLILMLLYGLPAGGCGQVTVEKPEKSTDGDGAADGEAITLATFDQRYIEALCSRLVNCASAYGLPWTRANECVDAFGAMPAPYPAELYKVDPAKAATCFQTLSELACDKEFVFSEYASCRGALIGKLNEGACCDSEGGCGPNLYCDATHAGVTGTCQPLKNAGASCRSSSECTPGNYCDQAQGCTPYKSEGDECSSDIDCGELACRAAECQTLGIAERDCTFTGDPTEDDCAYNTFCVGSDNSATCTPAAGEAETCDSNLSTNSDCSTWESALRCVGGACQAPAGEGQACSYDNSAPACESGLWCDQNPQSDESAGACQPPPGQGEDCSLAWICQDGLFCDFQSEQDALCEPKLGAGGDCGTLLVEAGLAAESPCEDGLICAQTGDTSSGLECVQPATCE